MKSRIPQMALILGVSSLLAIEAWSKDKPVQLRECPAPVQTVIQQYVAQGGTLEEIGLDEKKKAGGSPVYEAKFTLTDGRRIELHISPGGQIITLENKKPKKN